MPTLIRLAAEADAEQIASIYRRYVEDSWISFEDTPPDAAEMKRRMTGERPGFHPWFVAEQDGRLLGYAASSPFRTRSAYRWTVETGIYLAADAQGRGIGKALLSALLGVLERQGYVAAIGAIALPTTPAWRCTRSSASPMPEPIAGSGSSSANGSTSGCGRSPSPRDARSPRSPCRSRA